MAPYLIGPKFRVIIENKISGTATRVSAVILALFRINCQEVGRKAITSSTKLDPLIGKKKNKIHHSRHSFCKYKQQCPTDADIDFSRPKSYTICGSQDNFSLCSVGSLGKLN